MSTYKMRTQASWARTMNELEDTLKKWGATNFDVNYPRGARSERWEQPVEDRRVIVTFQKDGRDVRLEMDKQSRAVDNLRVIFICIEAMRMNERRGIDKLMGQVFMQLTASVDDPYQVLRVFRDDPDDVIDKAYKERVKETHPDTGGNAAAFKRVTDAYKHIMEGRK